MARGAVLRRAAIIAEFDSRTATTTTIPHNTTRLGALLIQPPQPAAGAAPRKAAPPAQQRLSSSTPLHVPTAGHHLGPTMPVHGFPDAYAPASAHVRRRGGV
jgi:hypothetical protein